MKCAFFVLRTVYGIDGARKCGLLYNWYAVKLMNDYKNTLFPGWHIATNQEFIDLVESIGGASNAGKKLKSKDIFWGGSWNGTDEYGFNLLPSGYYYASFGGIGTVCDLWTGTEDSPNAFYRYLLRNNDSIVAGSLTKEYGCAVRLVKDY